MNIFTKKLTLFVAFLLTATPILTAQTPSTVGTDFYVMFLRNDKNMQTSGSDYSPASATYYPKTVQLLITAQNDCTGTISCTNGYWSTDFEVVQGEVTRINVPKNDNSDRQAGYSYYSGVIEDKAIHVTATDEISLFAANYEDASFDITNVLPVTALGTEYVIQDYKGTQVVSGKNAGAVFAIAATEDNTVIDITPTANTGVFKPWHNTSQGTTYPAGETITITLNAGQSYQLMARGLGSLDGTRIQSHDCKRIAVFQGNSIAGVPGPISSAGWGYGDHLYEQCIPTEYWGKEFIVTQSLQRANDRVKVTSYKDNCEVKVNGNVMTTINAYETYEFEIVKNQAADTIEYDIDKVYGAAHYIETSEPTSVFLYMTSREYGNAIEQIGDPSMVLVTPAEQQIDYITFGTFQTDRIEFHHLNITAHTYGISEMYLDDVNIASQFVQVPGNTEYSYARIDIEEGSHTLRNPKGGFTAHVYGFGQGQGRDESYAYSVGTGTMPINQHMFINETLITYFNHTYNTCANASLDFTVTTNYEHGDITWDFGDGTTLVGDEVSHTYTAEGEYLVTAMIQHDNAYCDEGAYETVNATVVVGSSIETTEDYTICSGSEIEINGVTYDQAGTYTQQIETETGCDNILTINIAEVSSTANAEIIGDTLYIMGCVMDDYLNYGVSSSDGIDSVAWSIDYADWTVETGGIFGGIINTNGEFPTTEYIVLTLTTYNICGSHTTSITIHFVEDGIAENSITATIFPNPTDGKLNISAEGLRQVRVIDVIGQVISDNTANSDDIVIDLSQYGKGVYLVEVTTQNGKATQRVVVR